jgi:2-C-methyl-D-erythritol 4-phosphate cytidylyltransferase
LGARFGSRKQFASLGGRRLVDHVVETARIACDGVVIVLPPDEHWAGPPVAAVVPGGATRSASVRAGMGAVPATAEIVVIHDAAHPLATKHLFDSVIAAVQNGADAAVPVLPVTDPLKRVQDGRVVADVPREGILLMQTPHAFRAGILRSAHRSPSEVIEDTLLVQALGAWIAVVPGDPRNLHVTTPEELELAARLVGSG